MKENRRPGSPSPLCALGIYGGSRRAQGRRAESILLLFLISLCEAVLFGIDTGHLVETLCQHVVRYFGIYLCRFDVRVPQHPTDHLNTDTLRQRVGRGERVTGSVIGYRLIDDDFCRYFLQHPVAVGDVGHRQYEVRSRDLASVFVVL